MTGLAITNPINFASVIASDKVVPGDTLLLRAGTYTGDWTLGIGGTEAQPVTIKPYNGEAVVIAGTLAFGASYVKMQDLEITAPITMNYPGCELIGCYIHNAAGNGVSWFGSGAGRIAECLFEDNGADADLHHAIYSHNNAGGARVIERNLFLDQFGKYTIQIYSGGSNYLKDYTVQDNVFWGDPVHTGGGLGLRDFIYRRNVQYGDYGQQGRYGYANQNVNGQILDNVFFQLDSYTVNEDCDLEWLNLTESGNEVYGGEPSVRAGYTVYAYPAAWSRLIPFTLSERWSGIQATIDGGVFSAAMVAV